MSRTHVLSVTIRDCRVDTFASGGKGGQNQNKRHTGVRVVHEPSGAVGESREFREQIRNKRAAFRRMAESKKFRDWVHLQAGRGAAIEAIVDEQMRETNLRVEVREGGKWVAA